MSNIQYFHIQREAIPCTVAVSLPLKQDLETLFALHGNQSLFPIGVSIKSKKDKFIKKVGREQAHRRLTPLVVDFGGVVQRGTKHEYYFQAKDLKIGRKSYGAIFTLVTIATTQKVRLVAASLYEET